MASAVSSTHLTDDHATASVSMTPQFKKTTSKSMSWLLRHGAEKEGVAMDAGGWVTLSDLLAWKRLKSTGVTREHVQYIVDSCEKRRFALSPDGSKIRANQGHSVSAVKEEELLVPVEDAAELRMCVHSTFPKAVDAITRSGLSRMSRRHIHMVDSFATHEESGAISGVRRSARVHVHVDAAAAMAAGIKFHRSANGVILSAGNEDGFIPAEFCTIKDARTGELWAPR